MMRLYASIRNFGWPKWSLVFYTYGRGSREPILRAREGSLNSACFALATSSPVRLTAWNTVEGASSGLTGAGDALWLFVSCSARGRSARLARFCQTQQVDKGADNGP